MIRDYLTTELESCFNDADLFDQVDALQGDVYRQVATRRTFKINLAGRHYFVKVHHGVGWTEIIKNLLQGRLPVLGARNEWIAIKRLTEHGVPTMTASLYCERGSNPAKQRSAIVTESLEPTISLEDYSTEDPLQKRRILSEVARVSREMHRAGVNHRDFYLCHFLMQESDLTEPHLYLIDLHRAQVRSSVPPRWQVKDLGGLLFSAFDKPLTRRDLLRFIRIYSDKPLREALADQALWKAVRTRAKKLYLQDHEAVPDHVGKLLSTTGDMN